MLASIYSYKKSSQLKITVQGADPTKEYEADSPVFMATDGFTNNVNLLHLFLDYLDDSNINTQDSMTGKTILHLAAVRDSTENILNILKKGANILMLDKSQIFEDEDTHRRHRKMPQLAIEIAIYNTNSSYFEALYQFINVGQPLTDLLFLQTHLIGAVWEKHIPLAQNILSVLSAPHTTLSVDDIEKVLHFKNLCSSVPVFHQTALYWANANVDKVSCLGISTIYYKLKTLNRFFIQRF